MLVASIALGVAALVGIEQRAAAGPPGAPGVFTVPAAPMSPLDLPFTARVAMSLELHGVEGAERAAESPDPHTSPIDSASDRTNTAMSEDTAIAGHGRVGASAPPDMGEDVVSDRAVFTQRTSTPPSQPLPDTVAPPPAGAEKGAPAVLGVTSTGSALNSAVTEEGSSRTASGGSDPFNARAMGLLSAMNAVRLAEGLHPFAVAVDLSGVAYARSEDMVTRGYFSHVSPAGDSWISLLNRQGIRVKSGGENLARVSGDEERSVAVAILHLMESPTHRANILGKYSEVGVAAVTDEAGVTVFTAIFALR